MGDDADAAGVVSARISVACTSAAIAGAELDLGGVVVDVEGQRLANHGGLTMGTSYCKCVQVVDQKSNVYSLNVERAQIAQHGLH